MQTPTLKALWQQLIAAYRLPEEQAVQNLLAQSEDDSSHTNQASFASSLITAVRAQKPKALSIEGFLQAHKLSSQEGLAMMCLAEALLRIPDASTKNKFIRDKVSAGDWTSEETDPLAIRLANIGLLATTKILNAGEQESVFSVFSGLIKRFGAPAIRTLMVQAVKIMGQQFVMGETITKALKESTTGAHKAYRHTFDMLGEAAKTQEDADRYFALYMDALEALGTAVAASQDDVANPSLSIKLSALHPRYEVSQEERVREELLPRLLELVQRAAQLKVAITIDAEESERLTLSLILFEALYTHPSLKAYEGLGLAVQAYQKRAPHVIDWLIGLAQEQHKRIGVRLVKGAYWDSEIKRTQVNGLQDYAVYTHKSYTDLSYLICAAKMLKANNLIFCQFATHNAYTLAAIYHMAQTYGAQYYEFQRLHGMGESLYDNFFSQTGHSVPCRVYAPVGLYKDLLAYLVRRLLENGANTSFVNHIYDASKPVESLVESPVETARHLHGKPHAKVPLPANLFAPERTNSVGIDLSDGPTLETMRQSLEALPSTLPEVPMLTENALKSALDRVHAYHTTWSKTPATQRAQCLENLGALLTANYGRLLHLLILEGKKTLPDAVAEVREAIDFCYYYAQQGRTMMAEPRILPGPTGEVNKLYLSPRGTFACISPWNFPCAIFLGQVAAALVAGNTVIAKPASNTPVIASYVVELAHQAGIPHDALCLAHASGSTFAEHILRDTRIAGVAFTGSTETARSINLLLAERPGPIVPFIAETGGINAMIVDSSALPEQVVNDVIISGFQSAGQRCSALRILCLQQDVAEPIIHMIKGAMKELNVGDPAWIKTDVGPVIDRNAKEGLLAYVEELRANPRATCLHTCDTPADTENHTYVAPQLWQVESVKDITREAFGPIVHVVTFRSDQLDRLIDDINATGFGLTFGLHSRLESTIHEVFSRIHAGNVYINRSMIGAVVGVQPFGGEGLSGTGFKAGGPHYLLRFVTERTYTHDITAAGGNASLLAEI